MKLSELAPELRLLPSYEEVTFDECESSPLASWKFGVMEVDVWDGPGETFMVDVNGTHVGTFGSVDAMLETVRVMCELGGAFILATDGPVTYQAKVLLDGMGYRTVLWHADLCDVDDEDGMREAGLSAAALAMGSAVLKSGVCVEARCLGATVRA